jgi:hypothetical protein
MEAFDAPATEAPAILPAAFVAASIATRPVLTPGGQPGAVVVLLEFEVRGGGA